jgi:hypothetical protein
VAPLAALVRRDHEEVGKPLHPERFVEAALYHKVTGYVARALEGGRVRLDGRLRERLARRGAIQLAHGAALRAELARIEPVLGAACGAPPICVKGPAIADGLYPDRRLRPFADLDLVVPRESLSRAAAVLAESGYRPLEEFHAEFGERHGHDRHVVRRIGVRTLDVELHWRVGDDPACAPLDHARLYSQHDRVAVAGGQVHVPPLPEHMLCLAAHLLSDRAKRLIWVQDLAVAGGAASAADWRRGFEIAERLELGWVLHRALDYAARHLRFERERPLPAGPAPAWGPLRAAEDLDMRASIHVGRLAQLGWGGRAAYLREVLVPTTEGLRGTVGKDGAPRWRLLGRHARAIAYGVRPRRR